MISLREVTVAAVSFTISLMIIPVLIKVLRKWEIFEAEAVHKIHTQFTPSVGGIAIFLGMILALAIGLSFQGWIEYKYFFIATGLMFLVGLRDDILTLSPHQKLVGQFLPIMVLLFFDELLVDSSFEIVGFTNVPDWIFISFSVVAFILVTNAFNLIDGLDGLASSIGMIGMLCFGIWFYLVQQYYLSLIAYTMVGALMAFLIFNWEPSKIFMGDTGALIIGFMLAYFALQFINLNIRLPIEHVAKFNGSLGAAVSVLIIPCFDTARIIILRLRKGLSPFKGDKNHLHHQFLKLGFSHAKSVVLLSALNVAVIVLAILLKDQSDIVLLPIIIVMCLFVNFGLKRAQRHVRSDFTTQ